MKKILQNKFITLMITGGIAAYKTPILVRRLKEKGAEVQVVITKNAEKFVSPLSLETVSNNKVISTLFSPGDNIKVEHIDIADKSDFIIIAPATANIISKISCGIADDFLTSTVLAYKKKLLFVPAMNVNMYDNPIIQKNINYLKSIENYYFLEPDEGELACGYSGRGRMPDPDIIVKETEFLLSPKPLKDKKILITAGATREFIDPVRFISNPSSGKMGYALATLAAKMGAQVTLLSGKTCLEIPYKVHKTEFFESVKELKKLTDKHIDENDLLIMTAAVGDLRIKNYSKNKIKKSNNWNLEFESTEDILKSLKDKKIFKIGFAAESENLKENALKKLKEKNLNMIVLNDISGKDIGFSSNQNAVTIISEYKIEKTEKADKILIAEKILQAYLNLI